MTTGKFKCPICKKWRSYKGKYEQSILKIDTGRITQVTKLKIYDHVCLECFYNIKKIVNIKEVLE